ncbi:MAG: penicillin-binding protein activator LpoB [Treponemataceae bacterium]|nr:penicillin-binding protein activator LpoB [Treponemataceae bacterium]
MKKKILTLLFMAMVLIPSFAQKSGVEISAAVTDAAAAMARQMEAGKIAAVTRFSSDTKELSEWLENETFRALSKNSVRLVERNGNNMRIVDSELNFQYSGAVSEATIAAYGQKLGARYIVYGNFEQFGGIKVLEFRMTDVESFEVLVAKTYEIASSKLLTELLGSEAELLSIDDYIVAINNLENKKAAVEKDLASDRERTENRIRAEYQKRIDDVTTQITQDNDGFLSPSALKGEITNATKPLEDERDLLIDPVAENSRTKFADQLSMISNNRATIVKKMQGDTFVIGAESLTVNMDKRVGDRNSYFTLNMNSTDRHVKFTLNDTINPTDKEMFKKIRVALEETKSIKGEVEYKVRQSGGPDSVSFDVVIVSARLYDGISGDTFYKKTNFSATEADGGTINMTAQKTGTATKRSSSSNTKSSSPKSAASTNNAKKSDNVAVSYAKSDDSKTTKKSKSPNEEKRRYFDFGLDGTFWIYNYEEHDSYYDEWNNYSIPNGDFTFSFPIPFGVYTRRNVIIEPARLNVGIRGFYGQALGIGYCGKKIDFIVYIASVGLNNYWWDISLSFLDLKLAIKIAKHFNLELTARPLNLTYVYSPDFSLGISIPLRF